MVKFRKAKGIKVWTVVGPLDEVKVGSVTVQRRDGGFEEIQVKSLGQPFSNDKGGVLIVGYFHKGAKKETKWHKQNCSCCGDPGGVVEAYEASGPKGYVCLECARIPRPELSFSKGAAA